MQKLSQTEELAKWSRIKLRALIATRAISSDKYKILLLTVIDEQPANLVELHSFTDDAKEIIGYTSKYVL